MTSTSEGWPFEGYPVLPTYLRRLWGEEQIPAEICRKAKLPLGTPLARLDAFVWNEASKDGIKDELARYLLKLVQSRLYHRDGLAVKTSLFSHLSVDAALLDHLPLSRRAVNALARLGTSEEILAWLRTATVEDLFLVQGIGPQAFLEIVTIVEAHLGLEEGLAIDATLRNAFDSLQKRFPLDAISASDPRLKALRISHGVSLEEGLTHLLLGARSKKGQERARKIIGAVGELLDALDAELLDEALARLLSVCVSRRHFQIVMKRVGWDGNGGCSLQEAGDAAGLTRERVRQLEGKLKKRCLHVSYFPQLDRAIDLLEAVASDPTVRPEVALLQAKLTNGEFLPYGVKVAAEFCGREVRFETKMGSRQLGSAKGLVEKAIKRTLGELGDLAYVATVAEFRARLLEKQGIELSIEGIRSLLSVDSIRWLDEERNWFWHPAGYGGSRFLNFARKILAVSPDVSLDSLREGIFRHHRCAGLTLPRLTLASLLESAGFAVRNGMVEIDRLEFTAELSEAEAALISIIRQAENVTDIDQLLRAWRQTPWKKVTLLALLGNAPFIERVAPSVYALRGAALDPARVARLTIRGEKRRLTDFGWTDDKSIWVGLEVTSTLLSTAIFYLPAAVRRLIGLGPFELFAADHTKVGTLKMNDQGQAWGLGPFLTRRGLEVGDILIITLDQELRAAYAQVNGRELLARFREGEGKGPRALMEEGTNPDLTGE